MSTPIVHLKPGAPVPEAESDSIALAEGISPEEVIHAIRPGRIRHVVQKEAPFHEAELSVAHSMVEKPEIFFANPVEAIIGRSLDSEGLLCLQVHNTVDERKARTLGQFENFLKALPGTKTIRESALVVADELYTNAARNGFPPGSKRGEGPAREGTVDFTACVDGARLVFGCVDSFGELSMSRLIGRIGTVIDQGVADAIQTTGTGGAGIGSYMVFSSVMSYYIGVSIGKKTVVMVSMPLGLSARAAAEIPKNIHLLSWTE